MQTTDKSAIVEHVILASLVHLVRQVPKGTDRDHLETQAELLRREAALERRMFRNRAGADRLEWKADLVELAAQVRFPIDGDRTSYVMRDRVKGQLQVMCGGYVDNSDCAGAIRQAVRMALVDRRIRLDDIVDVVARWEPLRERQADPAMPRRPILEVIEGGQSAAPPRIAKFG
ncbi:hypothetical protein [Agrobacterium radiobacter]|uniref:hypothetical protein n=1 Tax=Agrobacterium radiobacter TaxID=362 RepID=UPI003CE472F5